MQPTTTCNATGSAAPIGLCTLRSPEPPPPCFPHESTSPVDNHSTTHQQHLKNRLNDSPKRARQSSPAPLQQTIRNFDICDENNHHHHIHQQQNQNSNSYHSSQRFLAARAAAAAAAACFFPEVHSQTVSSACATGSVSCYERRGSEGYVPHSHSGAACGNPSPGSSSCAISSSTYQTNSFGVMTTVGYNVESLTNKAGRQAPR